MSLRFESQRLDAMRRYYANSMAPSNGQNAAAELKADPFYDRSSWFQVIGRSYVLLSNLLHDTPLMHSVPIVSEKGSIRGHIKVTVQAILGADDTKSSSTANYARLHFDDGRRSSEPDDSLPAYMQLGSEFTFRIIILEVSGDLQDYSDIFCQFSFAHRPNEAFSTEPLQSAAKGPPLGFFHIQHFTVVVTRAFIDYLRTQSLLFEVLGHCNHHPLHSQASISHPTMPLKYLAPAVALSKPIPAKSFQSRKNWSPSKIIAEHDLLVWYEICELETSGE
jgi:kinesin family protein 1